MGITVKWTAFPLHPDTPEDGLSLKELFSGRNIDIPAMLAQMRQTAAAEGLPFGDRHRTYNSRRAQELGKWAEDQGRGEVFHNLAFRAYFADGKNIARPEVLAELADEAGLDPDEAAAVLTGRRYAEAVDHDWERSRILGISAVPTFSVDGRRLVGAKSYAQLRDLVTGKSTGNGGFPQ